MKDEELERFKSGIDLRVFAASRGYQLDRRNSWRGSAVMRHPASHDKIIIKLGTDGHWQFYSVRDDRDNGTIIDFVQFRQGLSLGAVREELRPWLNQSCSPVPAFAPLHRTEKDLMKVDAAFARMRDATDGHPYLERGRALSASIITQDRFAGRIRIDRRGNAVFPHFDGNGLSGYEVRNVNFKGFSSGGEKSLWLSNETPDDRCLVFCESAIDALSHAELFPDDRTRYASIAGKLNPQQAELIRAAAARMPHGSEIVAAMDSDEEGRKLTAIVRKAVELTGRTDLQFRVQEPVGYKDFNDQLRGKAQMKHPAPLSTADPR
jgi:hypothetical protein